MQAAVLNPLAPSPRDSWNGHGIRVTRRRGPHRLHDATDTVCTPRFCVQRRAGILSVEHNLEPEELCDELTTMLVSQLVDSGALRGQPEFEQVFTGVVRSTVEGGLASWLRFYRNSMDKLEGSSTTSPMAFAPIHAWAASLMKGCRLVDMGSCFGFFPLRMSRRGISVTATDLNPSTMHLLTKISTALHRPVTTLACDAADVPLPDRSADTVTALHLLEHLPADAATAVVDEAIRLARHRVVIAVPFEDEPQACYGHLRRYDLTSLRDFAAGIRLRHRDIAARAYEFHGGWVVLDRS